MTSLLHSRFGVQDPAEYVEEHGIRTTSSVRG